MTYYYEIEKADNWYIINFPDMKNIQTSAETLEEAELMAKEALEGSLIVCLQKDLPIQEPKFEAGTPVEISPKIAFAIELRKARAQRTKREAAQTVGMTYQQYQRLENPYKTNPTLEMMYRLQKAFGCKFMCL